MHEISDGDDQIQQPGNILTWLCCGPMLINLKCSACNVCLWVKWMLRWKIHGTSVLGMPIVELIIGKHLLKGGKFCQSRFHLDLSFKVSPISAITISSAFEAIVTKGKFVVDSIWAIWASSIKIVMWCLALHFSCSKMQSNLVLWLQD